MASGYVFKLVSIRTKADSTLFEVTNRGVAPIYYDAYVAVDGVRSEQTLKLLCAGDTLLVGVAAGATNATITIESDKLVEGQEIQFYGTQYVTGQSEELSARPDLMGTPYPNPLQRGGVLFLESSSEGEDVKYDVYDSQGKVALSGSSAPGLLSISTGQLEQGVYLLKVTQNEQSSVNRFMIL